MAQTVSSTVILCLCLLSSGQMWFLFGIADVPLFRIADLKCRLGAPYLYVHVGACEHLISFNNLALRDKCHPQGLYPLPIFERNSRRIACAGCKEVTSEYKDSNPDHARCVYY
ncbi:hypothetical protein COOONC_03112 [Cooperia oncophora]